MGVNSLSLATTMMKNLLKGTETNRWEATQPTDRLNLTVGSIIQFD